VVWAESTSSAELVHHDRYATFYHKIASPVAVVLGDDGEVDEEAT